MKEPSKDKGQSIGASKKKPKNQTNAKDFPSWCMEPCPKCSAGCGRKEGHAGKHKDGQNHVWE